MKNGEKKKLIRKIKDVLSSYKEISFAYIFGSFTDSFAFRDIDIGIYLYNIKREDVLKTASLKMENYCLQEIWIFSQI